MSFRPRLFLRSCLMFSIVMIFAAFLSMLVAAVMRSHMLTASHFYHAKVKEPEADDDQALGIGDMYSDDPLRRYAAALHIYETKLEQDEFVLIKNTNAVQGNFPCSQSIVEGSCAFYVDTLQEAEHICQIYQHFCIGFVLTDDMVVHLKRAIFRIAVTEKASFFLRRDSLFELQRIAEQRKAATAKATTEKTLLSTHKIPSR